jgi:organic hydroperoxide reductase OsmC/OhrA
MATHDGVHDYGAQARWDEGSGGHVEADGLPDLRTGPPVEFGGEPGVWTPEHLFVSAANACLMNTFLAIARHSRLLLRGWSSAARGRLEKVEGKGWMFTEIAIDARIEVASRDDVERAHRLFAKAEASCLIARSIASRMSATAVIEVDAREPAGASG